MIVLQWLRRSGDGEISRFDKREISLGLSPRNDLVLEGRGLIKKHCTITEPSPGLYQIVSMSGKETAFVNGSRCFRGPLRAGDRIQLGTTTFLFLGDGTTPIPAEPHALGTIDESPVEAEARGPERSSRSGSGAAASSQASPATEEKRSHAGLPAADESSPNLERRSRSRRRVSQEESAKPAAGPESVAPSSLPRMGTVYTNAPAGMTFRAEPGAEPEPSRRGRRPIELADIEPATPWGALRRAVHDQFLGSGPFLASARQTLETLGRAFEGSEFLLAIQDARGAPHVTIAVGNAKSFVFSRKILSESERPRPLATREGDRITLYFPLVKERGRLVGFLIARGEFGALDREFLEEVSLLFTTRIAAIDGDALLRPPAAVGAGPAVFDPDTGTLSDGIDDLKVIVEAVERRVIDRVMRRTQGNQSRGAALLKVSRGSLIAKLKTYGIPDYRNTRRL